MDPQAKTKTMIEKIQRKMKIRSTSLEFRQENSK